MSRRKNPETPRHDVTDTELAVLKALWQRGTSTIRELTAELYPGGGTALYATVQKLLSRLETKGCVSRQLAGRANVYRPLVNRHELIVGRLQATADRLCGGSMAPLLSALAGAAEAAELTVEDVSALRDLVERLDRDGGTR